MKPPRLVLKNGVRINGAHFYPEMTRITEALRITAPPTDDLCVWITSAADGKHMAKSLHYVNRAFDVRIRNIVGDIDAEAALWCERLRSTLGKDYDVVLEGDHIHIEFDPKEA